MATTLNVMGDAVVASLTHALFNSALPRREESEQRKESATFASPKDWNVPRDESF